MADNKLAPITQRLLNSYPMWSTIRNDEQANGASYLNVIGLALQDLQEQLINQEKNYTLPFANTNDIDTIYKFFLPKTFQFAITNEDTTNPVYSPPTVVGTIGSTPYTLALSDNNDIKSFWYTSVPTRLTTTSYPVTNVVNDQNATPMYGCLASITQDQSPFTINLTLDNPMRLWVQAVGGQKYIAIGTDGIVRRASIIITGITRAGVEATETVSFINDDMIPTMKDWSYISKLEVYDCNPTTTNIRLFAHRFKRNQTPLLQPPKAFYQLYSSPETKQQMDTFWELGINTATNATLKLQTYQVDDIRDRMNGFVDLDTMRSFELHNSVDTALTSMNDLCVEPFSDRLWMVDNKHLYLYDGDWTLPNMQQLTKKETAPLAIMEMSAYHITPGDSVSIEYLHRRQITDPTFHRVWVQYPDGSLHTALNGSFSAYTTAMLNNFPGDRMLRHKEIYTLPTPGDYIFSMEVHYSNGDKEIDQRIVSVDTKVPLKEFDFTAVTAGNLVGVDFDSDGKMWILVDTTGTFTKLLVNFAYDTMMVDYQNKIIYLKEQYDQIRVS